MRVGETEACVMCVNLHRDEEIDGETRRERWICRYAAKNAGKEMDITKGSGFTLERWRVTEVWQKSFCCTYNYILHTGSLTK